ncbi:MAG: HAD family phosphatase [Gemmatimonadota bacterium]
MIEADRLKQAPHVLGACFDFNGVIVDDERHHCRALIDTLAEVRITLQPDEYYRDYLGHDDAGCFHHAWRSAGRALEPGELVALIERKGERYRTLLDADLTLVPGIVDFLRALAGNETRMVVVSAARRWEIEHVLTRAGVRDCFVGIVAAEDVERTKPDPEGYLKGLATLGLPADRCVVVEDSIPGARAGRSAGMRVAMVTTSHPHEELLQAEPDVIWTNFVGHTPEELPWNPI